MKLKVKSFYHQPTYTWTHLLICCETKQCVLIDPVLDFNCNNGNTSTQSCDKILDYMQENDCHLKYAIETHAHADHLTAAHYLKDKTQAKIAIGHRISTVQKTFKNIFNLNDSFRIDGSQFDKLIKPGEVLKFGVCQIKAMHTPGHTQDSMSYICQDCVFIGDTLFSPDYGSARCDFPGGNANDLYDSVQAIYALGEHMKLYLCHDYPPQSRNPQAIFLSNEQQSQNIHLNKEVSRNEFVKRRNDRDKELNHPKLIIPAIQVNIDAGKFPEPELNGNIYLKMPINVLGES